mmetsp:Transcript_83263/g.209908  ORF Transcript_83263/g.209908 Transcript_83263/m.209908 type:complete len:589 (+) Transcript_83263:69-1835(+)
MSTAIEASVAMPTHIVAAAADQNKAVVLPAAALRPTKLFIGGLTRHTTTQQLRDHFSQYGRILDCVAMRKPDGHPRGFGYVTLDSVAAAERCLAEAQVIDGREVDMKRAVPGNAASNSSSPNSSHSPQDAAKRQNMQQEQQQPWRWQQQQQQQQHGAGAAGGLPGALLSPFSPLGAWDIAGAYLNPAMGFPGSPHSPAAAWAASWAAAAAAAAMSPPKSGNEMFDVLRCGASTGSPSSAQDQPETPVDRFGAEIRPLSTGCVGSVNLSRALGRRNAPALDLDDVVSPMSSSGCTPMGSSSTRTRRAGSSLTTPMVAPGRVPRGALDDETPQKVELSVKSARAGRSVLGDITNIVAGECNTGLSPLKAPLPTPSSIFIGRHRSPGLENHEATPRAASMRQPSFAVFDEGLDSPDAASTSLSDLSMRSQESSFCNLGLEVSRIEEAVDEDDEGADADDINTRGVLPHDNCKVSQHEKRDRRTTRLLEQSTALIGEVGKMSLAECCADARSMRVPPYPCSLPPGLSPPQRSAQADTTLSVAEFISNALVNLPASDGQAVAQAPAVKRTSTISTQTSPQKFESMPSSSVNRA